MHSVLSYHKEAHIQTLSNNEIFQLKSTTTNKFIRKTAQRPASSCELLTSTMNSWRIIRTFSQKYLLVHEIFHFKHFSKNRIIRRSPQHPTLSCHLLECHILLIYLSDFQPEIPPGSRNIPLLNIYRRTELSGDPLSLRLCRATSSSVIFS